MKKFYPETLKKFLFKSRDRYVYVIFLGLGVILACKTRHYLFFGVKGQPYLQNPALFWGYDFPQTDIL